MFQQHSGILQLMSQLSTLPPLHHEDTMIYSTETYPTLASYFINAMHDKLKLSDLERYHHYKSLILRKFIGDCKKEFLTESFDLGNDETKEFVTSLIASPEIKASDVVFFFYDKFEDDIKKIWDASKDRFEIINNEDK